MGTCVGHGNLGCPVEQRDSLTGESSSGLVEGAYLQAVSGSSLLGSRKETSYPSPIAPLRLRGFLRLRSLWARPEGSSYSGGMEAPDLGSTPEPGSAVSV